jgi:subtilisin family serine protease
MKINLLPAAILIFCINSVMAQNNNYYYYKGNRVNLSLDKDLSNQRGKLHFKRQNNLPTISISDIFYVKIKTPTELPILQQVASEKNVTIIHQNKYMPLWYKLKLNNGINKSSLEICNEFYETGYFEDVDPAFQFEFKHNCSNDNNFNDLWGLNNTTNPEIDINICDAWSVTEGNGINVAVLDQGVYKTHYDLDNNISPLSYDTQNGCSPSIFVNGREHGTHVAGTIAAEKNNNLQVVGVAPKSKIMSISHTLSISPSVSEELANGINWAIQNGAHIINNSWGDQGGVYYNNLHSAILEDAITNAIENGREGLGTILVFASGNHSPAIDYPASFHNDVLVTGAITSNGNKASYSGYGNELDIVAPGSGILSTIPNQGTDSWNGTSMAAPHVAGVAALILSVNPNLTVQEVNGIIEETAQKVGNYNYTNNYNRPNGTWHEKMGYGLINAYEAVMLAKSYNCPDNLSITSNVLSGKTDNQQAKYNITANNIVYLGGNANYSAGSSIILTSGFRVMLGANFKASIKSCDNLNKANSINIRETSQTNKYHKKEGAKSTKTDNNTVLSIYPNPNKGLFYIQSSKNIKFYSITDISGRQIIYKVTNNEDLSIDISKYPIGIYFLKVKIENGEIINKKILRR